MPPVGRPTYSGATLPASGMKMKAIQVSRNGKKLFIAGLEEGILDARFLIRNQVDPVWFDVAGRDRSTGGHARWAHISVDVGDTFKLELVDGEASDIDETST